MTTLIILLMVTLILPLIGIAIWFVLANKATEEAYDKAIEEIYARKRK